MSLPITNLDDRKFQDLVDEAKRMIPDLCPEWTNHNVSDPGVALIELFAWMTEMALYRLNQVPDVFYTRMLNLLGFKTFATSAARADITFWLSGGQDVPVEIAAGTEVTTVGDVGVQKVFRTLETATIQPPKLVGAQVSTGDQTYQDVWETLSLRLGSIPCFSRLQPDDCLYLGFERSLASNAIRLDITAAVHGIGIDPNDPPIAWEVFQGEGWARLEVPKVPGGSVGGLTTADETGGLNRSGSVLLLIPNAHQPSTINGVAAYWIRLKLLPYVDGQKQYVRSPEISAVVESSIGANVAAEHSQLIENEILGISNGRPDQAVTSNARPVLKRNDDEFLQVFIHRNEHGIEVNKWQDWSEVSDFVDSSPADRHYTWDSSTGEIRFGPLIRYPRVPDGDVEARTVQHGAVPPEGAQLRLTRYRSGGGEAGNVGVGMLTGLRRGIPSVIGVTNLKPSRGGVDAENPDNAKRRGPQWVRSGGRAVTTSDFQRLTHEADARIARVRCLAPEVVGQAVRLFVVPSVKGPAEEFHIDNFELPASIIENINDYLGPRRVLGSTIEVSSPFYQGVTVATRLIARPNARAAIVEERASRALYKFIHPIKGGLDGKGWPFDEDLNATQVIQVLEAVEGVERVDVVTLFEYDLRNEERLGFAKEVIRLEADSLFISASHQVVVIEQEVLV